MRVDDLQDNHSKWLSKTIRILKKTILLPATRRARWHIGGLTAPASSAPHCSGLSPPPGQMAAYDGKDETSIMIWQDNISVLYRNFR